MEVSSWPLRDRRIEDCHYVNGLRTRTPMGARRLTPKQAPATIKSAFGSNAAIPSE